MKKIIKLTESDIHNIILESLNGINKVAKTNPVTVCSADDFSEICSNQFH